MFKNKTVILIVILIIIVVLLMIGQIVSERKQPVPSPTPFKTPTTAYDPNQLSKDYQRITQRKGLSSEDTKIKEKLLTLLGGKSGIVTKTDSYIIEYAKSPDIFMVEITNTDAQLARESATSWLKQQGLSAEGICNLPVKFYLSYEVNKFFQQHSQVFNPIPEGCS